MMEARSPSTDKSQDIAARLRAAIADGRLMPNERLIEADLSETMGANRANIRMALAMLDQEGLIVRERHRGARVRLVTDEEAIEIAQTRAAIETMVARQAAERATDKDKKALRAICADMQAAFRRSDLLGFSDINGKLHQEIQRIAAHTTANRLLQTLRSHVVRIQYRAIMLPGRAAESLAEHKAIVEAVCANDAAAAETAMRRHLTHVVHALARTIEAMKPRPRTTKSRRE